MMDYIFVKLKGILKLRFCGIHFRSGYVIEKLNKFFFSLQQKFLCDLLLRSKIELIFYVWYINISYDYFLPAKANFKLF